MFVVFGRASLARTQHPWKAILHSACCSTISAARLARAAAALSFCPSSSPELPALRKHRLMVFFIELPGLKPAQVEG
jgi:hypothetical protein